MVRTTPLNIPRTQRLTPLSLTLIYNRFYLHCNFLFFSLSLSLLKSASPYKPQFHVKKHPNDPLSPSLTRILRSLLVSISVAYLSMVMEDNESCGSRVHDTSSPSQSQTRQQRLKLEVYNEVLRRLKDSKNDEAILPGFDDQLWAHFNRLPTRYLYLTLFSQLYTAPFLFTFFFFFYLLQYHLHVRDSAWSWICS